MYQKTLKTPHFIKHLSDMKKNFFTSYHKSFEKKNTTENFGLPFKSFQKKSTNARKGKF